MGGRRGRRRRVDGRATTNRTAASWRVRGGEAFSNSTGATPPPTAALERLHVRAAFENIACRDLFPCLFQKWQTPGLRHSGRRASRGSPVGVAAATDSARFPSRSPTAAFPHRQAMLVRSLLGKATTFMRGGGRRGCRPVADQRGFLFQTEYSKYTRVKRVRGRRSKGGAGGPTSGRRAPVAGVPTGYGVVEGRRQ